MRLTAREITIVARSAGSRPGHSPELVERTLLEEVVELHPERLTIEELALRTAPDPDDSADVEAIRQAIRDLRRSGLLRYRNDDEVVEPTHAAMTAYALLTA